MFPAALLVCESLSHYFFHRFFVPVNILALSNLSLICLCLLAVNSRCLPAKTKSTSERITATTSPHSTSAVHMMAHKSCTAHPNTKALFAPGGSRVAGRHQTRKAFSMSCPLFPVEDFKSFERAESSDAPQEAFTDDGRKPTLASTTSQRDLLKWIRESCKCENQLETILTIESNLPCTSLRRSNSESSLRRSLHESSGFSSQGYADEKELLKSLAFNALNYPPDDLVELCVEIFLQLKLDVNLKISRRALGSFVSNVRRQMAENPYHNWYHVVDVAQTIYALGLQSGLIQMMSDTERLALLIAALCHDLDHPGVNNSFLIKSRSALASKYAMHVGCLEKHHSFRASELMSNEASTGLLDVLAPGDKLEVMSRVQALILATDMSRHGEYMALLTTMIRDQSPESPASAGLLEDSHRQVLAEVLIKCADMSNVLKPFPVAKSWAVRITDEFFLQGDLERSLGMEVSRPCDRRTESRVGVQKGFIAFVVPFYAAVGELLPGLRPAVGRLEGTRRMWERYPSDAVLEAEMSLGLGRG